MPLDCSYSLFCSFCNNGIRPEFGKSQQVRNRIDKGSPALYVNGRVSNFIISEAFYKLQVPQIRRLYISCITNSEALCSLQLSQIRRLYICYNCHKFGDFIYVTSVTNSDLYVRYKCHKFRGFIYIASVVNLEALCTLQVSQTRRLYIHCKCRKFGGFMYIAGVINSGALCTLQVSPIRRLYIRCVTNSEAVYALQMSHIRRIYVRCKCHKFGGFASVTKSEALYALRVSQIRRLYVRCKCHKFGGFTCIAIITNYRVLTIKICASTILQFLYRQGLLMVYLNHHCTDIISHTNLQWRKLEKLCNVT
jgi:hypothetical protein